MSNNYVLETAAQEFSEANAPHPRIYELAPKDGRKLLEQVQASPVNKAAVDMVNRNVTVPEWGSFNVRLIRPAGNTSQLPVIFYIHGAGWVFGSAQTHDKLARELAVRTQSVVILPEYSRSPEAKYPTAIEQNYAVLQMLPNWASADGLDLSRLTVAGDSVGGNMATVMTILTKQRHGIPIHQQLLYYPVTNANFNTGSYNEFAEGYYLTKAGMQWFWDQYTTDPAERAQITASPLRAEVNELRGLPAAMILNGANDVLRDEGEAYANKLRQANVDVTQVRFQGMIHDFVMVNSLDQTRATRAAMTLSTEWVKQRNGIEVNEE